MNVIGIDVSKETLVCVRTDKSTKAKEVWTLPNTLAAVEPWLDSLTSKYQHLVFASEATAEYHRLVALACLKRKLPFRLLNPITTKQYTRATVRKRKTDLTDAHTIAKLALSGEGTLLTPAMLTIGKPIARTAIKLTQIQNQIELIRQRYDCLPETAEVLTSALTTCKDSLAQAAKTFQHQASASVDPHLTQLLCSIPGIGPTVSTVCLVEIGDITRFRNADTLIAFAGLDPKVKQSGKALHHNTHLTKRGSPYFRKMLYVAAGVGQQHDPELKAYYEKKRAEGKYYKEATCAVARKILYRIYAVWMRGTPYVKTKGT